MTRAEGEALGARAEQAGMVAADAEGQLQRQQEVSVKTAAKVVELREALKKEAAAHNETCTAYNETCTAYNRATQEAEALRAALRRCGGDESLA